LRCVEYNRVQAVDVAHKMVVDLCVNVAFIQIMDDLLKVYLVIWSISSKFPNTEFPNPRYD
jgi:hypothetical protein